MVSQKIKMVLSRSVLDNLAQTVYIYTLLKNTFWIVSWVIFLYLPCHFPQIEMAINFTKLSPFLRRKKKRTKKLNLKINNCSVSKLKLDRNCPLWHVFEFQMMNWIARTWAHEIILFLLLLLLPYNQHFIFLFFPSIISVLYR